MTEKEVLVTTLARQLETACWHVVITQVSLKEQLEAFEDVVARLQEALHKAKVEAAGAEQI